MGTRNPERRDEFKGKVQGDLSVSDVETTVDFSDIVVLAVKGSVAKSVVENLGSKLNGKTVIDPTNPISSDPPVNGVLRFFTNLDRSLIEELQEAAPAANFVKAFSMIGGPHMVNANFNGEKPGMFICGNDDKAKAKVTEICELFGFEVEDFGKVEAGRAIEPLCMLWCIPGMTKGQWGHAFKMLKK